MDKREIAAIFEEMATLLELKGENRFRVQAYRKGARAVLNFDESLSEAIEQKKLTSYAGIGEHLAQKIEELFKTGKFPEYEKLKKSLPKGLLQLIEIQGLGPRKVHALYHKLKVSTIEELKRAALKGRIAKLKGFGPKTEQKILRALEERETHGRRYLWWNAWTLGHSLLEQMRKIKGVKRCELCGSVRRKLETVGDLDFLAASQNPLAVIRWFTSPSMAKEVLAQGETKATIRLTNGMQADLRVVTPEQFSCALHYFTGSKEHTVEIRKRALQRGYSLSEYGLKPQKKKTAPPKVQSEEALYKILSLSYIPPELRENRGEIEEAQKGKLPQLIEPKHLRGTLHNHTTASDGKNSLQEMVEAAEALHWEYIGISDHSKSSVQAGGLSEERLLEQIEKIKALNRSRSYKIHIFAGTECDILASGALDYEDALLKKLDFVIASVHSSFPQDEKTMTRRIIRALEHPSVTMLGHPTGRLLLRRAPYAVNLEKVIDAAIANQKIIELNGNPSRLDLDWRYWRRAAEKGLLCCINCDAHSVENLQYYLSGVYTAQKGWLTPKQVINTWPLKKISKFLTSGA